ncbi:Zinc finger MYND domain-containing protein 15 [Neopestalotiopsis sp. 37M]|nr:Zinc finger MYND domain-containing protein 15 [Neopestalotiopsis sp. 37M]
MATLTQILPSANVAGGTNVGSTSKDIKNTAAQYANPLTQGILYLHPHLSQAQDPVKGRILSTNGPIRAGELLMADLPYAVVPVTDNGISDAVVCSNLGCSRQIPRQAAKIAHCDHDCSPGVLWCNERCKQEDQKRHAFECFWLKKCGAKARQELGAHDYHMLWIIVRILAARCLERHGATPTNVGQQFSCQDQFISGWKGVDMLRTNRKAWPPSQIEHWSTLIKTYLLDESVLPETLAIDDLVNLICAEETNVFELCPGPTEIFPGQELDICRGKQYGLALFLRITLANHSCIPNVSGPFNGQYCKMKTNVGLRSQVTHQADDRGRMIVTALRDIAAGEECCTSYFDLSKYVDLDARRRKTEELFTFTCQCPRCLQEERREE